MTDLVPLLRVAPNAKVTPGERLGRSNTKAASNSTRIHCVPGPGTYLRGGELYASVSGSILVGTASSSTSSNDKKVKTHTATVSVIPNGKIASKQVIRIGQIVLCKVTRMTAQSVMVEIVASEAGLLNHSPEGTVRRADIKTLSSDAATSSTADTTFRLATAFRPGDWIVARVLSMGDARRYFLSTAEETLGVIYATSACERRPLMALSHDTMQDPVTNKKEARKCARPIRLPREFSQMALSEGEAQTSSDAMEIESA